MASFEKLVQVMHDETVEVKFLDGSPLPPLHEEEIRTIVELDKLRERAEREDKEEAEMNAGLRN